MKEKDKEHYSFQLIFIPLELFDMYFELWVSTPFANFNTQLQTISAQLLITGETFEL